jgi:hypothetical protein
MEGEGYSLDKNQASVGQLSGLQKLQSTSLVPIYPVVSLVFMRFFQALGFF